MHMVHRGRGEAIMVSILRTISPTQEKRTNALVVVAPRSGKSLESAGMGTAWSHPISATSVHYQSYPGHCCAYSSLQQPTADHRSERSTRASTYAQGLISPLPGNVTSGHFQACSLSSALSLYHRQTSTLPPFHSRHLPRRQTSSPQTLSHLHPHTHTRCTDHDDTTDPRFFS